MPNAQTGCAQEHIKLNKQFDFLLFTQDTLCENSALCICLYWFLWENILFLCKYVKMELNVTLKRSFLC